jgi:hypothetical protein
MVQVRVLFLQWIPWFLRMSRPGEKITLKSILIQNKMKEIDTKVEGTQKSVSVKEKKFLGHFFMLERES